MDESIRLKEDWASTVDAINGWTDLFNRDATPEDKDLFSAISAEFKPLGFVPYKKIRRQVRRHQGRNGKFFSDSFVEDCVVSIITNEFKKIAVEKDLREYELEM